MRDQHARRELLDTATPAASQNHAVAPPDSQGSNTSNIQEADDKTGNTTEADVGDVQFHPPAPNIDGLTIVTTAEDLQAAVLSGASDIEIQSHLDLSGLRRIRTRAVLGTAHPLHDAATHMMYVEKGTRSIRGNCANASMAAEMIATDLIVLPPPLSIKPLQCVLIVGDSMLQFLSGTQWLDSIYFRMQRTRVNPNFSLFELGWQAPRSEQETKIEHASAQVYMTNITVQGSRRGSAHILTAFRGSKVLAQDCLFADMYGGGFPFHLNYESSAFFVNSMFLNIFVEAPVVEVASGGLVMFSDTTFRNIRVPDDQWVGASSDDHWAYSYAERDISIRLIKPVRDVNRTEVPNSLLDSDGMDTGNSSREYCVDEGFVYDEAYGLLDYDSDTEIVDFPQVPFALPNDSWLIQAQAVLPKRPTHVLAADPTLLDFPARDDHPWPALTTIRWKDRANAINTAGGASSVANRNDNHAAIITAVLCFTMLLAALIVVAWVQHRRRRSASSVSRVKMLGSELTEEVVKEALGHGVRMLDTLHETYESSAADSTRPLQSRRLRFPYHSTSWGWMSRTPSVRTARPTPATHADSTATVTSSGDGDTFLPIPRRASMLEISSQHMWEFSWTGPDSSTAPPPARRADTVDACGDSASEFEAQFQRHNQGPSSAPATAQLPHQHWTSSDATFMGAPRGRGRGRGRGPAAASPATTWLYVPEYSTVTSATYSVQAEPPRTPGAHPRASERESQSSSAPLPPRAGSLGGAVSPPPWARQERTITTFQRRATQPAARLPQVAVGLSVADGGGTSFVGYGGHSVRVTLTATADEATYSRDIAEPCGEESASEALRATSSTATSAHSAPAGTCMQHQTTQDAPDTLTVPLVRAQFDTPRTIAAVFPAPPSVSASPLVRSASQSMHSAHSSAHRSPVAGVSGEEGSGETDESTGGPALLSMGVERAPQDRPSGSHTAASGGMLAWLQAARRLPAADGATPAGAPQCGSSVGALRGGKAVVAALPWLHRRVRRSSGLPPPQPAEDHTCGSDDAPAVANFPSWHALQLHDQTQERAVNHELRRVERLLNGLGEGAVVFQKYRTLSRKERRRGGQAIIQFATQLDDGTPCAMKFFADISAFHTEVALYDACGHTSILQAPQPPTRGSHVAPAVSNPDTGKFLPRAVAIMSKQDPELEGMAAVTDPTNAPRHVQRLPPCIVMEKGESLHDWSERAEPDFFMALAVLSNVASRLADMHDAGYVHRDLKPSNVMWLPRENRWTVIDFGCAARAGESTTVCFTLTYASPEVIRAYETARIHGGSARCEVACSADMWALGVMAFELLTGRPAFHLLTDGRQHVVAQLLGELPLPWEGELTDAVRDCLGGFKGPILRLLHRDPRQRDTASQFYAACRHVTSATR